MMGAWFWLSSPLAAPIFVAICGIPLRLVLRSPDAGTRGKHGEPSSDQGSGRSSSSCRSCSSTLWHLRVFSETRQLATRSQRG